MRASPFVVAALVCVGSLAHADPPPPPHKLPRVFAAPTAWLARTKSFAATAGGDHRGRPFAAITTGLGHVAEVDVTVSGESERVLPTALFKVGLAGKRVAGALGFRKSFGRVERTAEMYAVGSAELGPVRLHAGAEWWDAEAADGTGLDSHLTPFGGVEWTPSIYPRSMLLADIAWQPRFDDPGGVHLSWLAGGGARYQAFSWGSIELAVQIREDDGLDRPTVIIRFNVTSQLTR